MTVRENGDEWKHERTRRDSRRMAERAERDKRVAYRVLTERLQRQAIPRQDYGPPPRID